MNNEQFGKHIKVYYIASIIGIALILILIFAINNRIDNNIRKDRNNYQIAIVNESKWENYYKTGISLIKEQKWQEAAVALVLPHDENYRDSQVLYDYASSHESLNNNDYHMAKYYLKDIPDSYSGELYEEILKYKKEISNIESKSIIEELSEPDTALIELLDCEWHRDGNYVYYTGKVKNNYIRSVSFIKVEVVYYDNEKGIMLDSDYTYAVGANPLEPGYVKSFNLITPYTNGMKWAECSVIEFN